MHGHQQGNFGSRVKMPGNNGGASRSGQTALFCIMYGSRAQPRAQAPAHTRSHTCDEHARIQSEGVAARGILAPAAGAHVDSAPHQRTVAGQGHVLKEHLAQQDRREGHCVGACSIANAVMAGWRRMKFVMGPAGRLMHPVTRHARANTVPARDKRQRTAISCAPRTHSPPPPPVPQLSGGARTSAAGVAVAAPPSRVLLPYCCTTTAGATAAGDDDGPPPPLLLPDPSPPAPVPAEPPAAVSTVLVMPAAARSSSAVPHAVLLTKEEFAMDTVLKGTSISMPAPLSA